MVLAVAEESVGMVSRGQEEAEASSIRVFSVRRIPVDAWMEKRRRKYGKLTNSSKEEVDP